MKPTGWTEPAPKAPPKDTPARNQENLDLEDATPTQPETKRRRLQHRPAGKKKEPT